MGHCVSHVWQKHTNPHKPIQTRCQMLTDIRQVISAQAQKHIRPKYMGIRHKKSIGMSLKIIRTRNVVQGSTGQHTLQFYL